MYVFYVYKLQTEMHHRPHLIRVLLTIIVKPFVSAVILGHLHQNTCSATDCGAIKGYTVFFPQLDYQN